jgi:Carboxypeptidase regulatory-like domain
MRKNLLVTFTLLLFAFFGARAQGVTTANVEGRVTDTKGEILPGTTITAEHVPSGTQYGASAREDGRYNILGMRVGGPYTFKVTFIGFKEQTFTDIYLQLGQTFVLDYKLVDESTTLAEVTVSGAQDPLLNSDKMGASSNFNVNQINRLPSIGRDFRDITAMTPQAGASAFSFGGRSNLYNNLTIDGATVNNVFGLSPIPAGQSGATPFSLDAIQEISVSLSPYDLRQGSFTSAGVSAITRSGSNEFSGSAYYFFRTQALAGKKINGLTVPIPNFNYKNYGFRLGGPIMKNKLFFFINGEIEDRTDPFYTNPVRPNAAASVNGATQATDDNDPQYGLAGLKDFLLTNYQYDPGVYKDFKKATYNTRFVARFDYNINPNNKLTVRGNFTNAYQDQPPSGSGGFAAGPNGGRGNTNNVLSFSSSYYRILNKQYSATVELNSTLMNGKMSNNLVAGYNAFRDVRQNAGGLAVPDFPLVDIIGPNGSTLTTFGPDPFTKNNRLDQDVYQLNDNISMYLRNHTVTVGTANELYHFNNVFTQVINGVYKYNSLADFYADAQPSTTGTKAPAQYTVQYVAVPGGPSATAANWSALQLGFFAQDEYTGIKNLKVTGGLRVDIPMYLTDLPKNNYVNSIDLNGEKLRVGAWPKVKPLFSPRIGFNWDVKGDRSTQVRGGTGVLTGRVPFVWLSNAVSNNGLFFGQYSSTTVPVDNTGDGIPYNYSTTPYKGAESSYSNLATGTPALITNPLDKNYGRSAIVPAVNSIAKNFKFPQVWRSNIAIDQKLPYGIVGTLEFIYTKDINAVFIRDANVRDASATLQGDGRPLYGAAGSDRTIVGNDRRLSGDLASASGALVLDNTKKGYQYSVTTQFQKTWDRNFSAMVAYTYTDSREVNPQSGSTAGGIYSAQANVLGANNPGMSYGNTLTPHRVIAYGSYRKEYLNHFATTLGLTYDGRSGFNFSYIYTGDVNSDGVSADLIYIPRDQSEIVLSTNGANDTRSIDQIWSQLDNYISQDKYLNSRRGQYAQRGGGFAPWVNRMNVNLLQDFYIDVKGKRNTIQLSLNIYNALNLMNSEWGLVKNPARSSLITFLGYEKPQAAGNLASGIDPATGAGFAPTTGRPVYTFATNADGTPLTSSWIVDQTVNGRWQMQLGVRYIF